MSSAKPRYQLYYIISTLIKVLFCCCVARFSPFMLPLAIESILLIFILICSRSTILTIFLIFAITINACQLANIYSTGEYLASLTVFNINQFHDIGSHIFSIISIILGYLLLYFVDFIVSRKVKYICNIRNILSICIVFFIILYCEINIITFPIHNFVNTAHDVVKIYTYKPEHINKEIFIRNKIPCYSKDYNINIQEHKEYNVIILFMEGTSYRVLSEEVTKNLWDLKNNSINIVNYFNHTAATFNGIRGQLISGYQLNPGVQSLNSNIDITTVPDFILKNTYSSVVSLPTILNDLGYNTVFVSPHPNPSVFNSWMYTIGFNKIYAHPKNMNLTDKEMYDFIYQNLQQLSKEKKKFFLGAYILGTHHGLDSPDAKYGDGSNPYLNKFYNHDIWFGEFLKKLKSSTLYDNTILVVTTDHATHPSPEFKQTFSSDVPYFVDKVPFIIHYKGVNPMQIDANYRNSLSMTPTVLDLLQICNVKNNFLGNSIFMQQDDSKFAHISNIQLTFYKTDASGVQVIDPNDPAYREVIGLIMDFFHFAR